ncbi:hypothetical protein KY342_01880 [Candidatus Woesearchaeota archaeon]|nr:hypothetical protein [Candidatus Woesearchaeota archaeon]
MLTREEIQVFKAKKLEKKYKDIFSSKDMIEQANELDKRLEKLRSNLEIFDNDLKIEKKHDDQMHMKTFQ